MKASWHSEKASQAINENALKVEGWPDVCAGIMPRSKNSVGFL